MDDTLKKVQEAFAAAFGIDASGIGLDAKPGDVAAWDSLGHVSLVSELERAFGMSFDVDEVMEMENVRQIVRIVEAKAGAAKA